MHVTLLSMCSGVIDHTPNIVVSVSSMISICSQLP